MKKLPFLSSILAITIASTSALAEDYDKSAEGWFRFDHDALGMQLWAGVTLDPGPSIVDFASNIYLFPQMTTCNDLGACSTSIYGELDLGISIAAGNFLFIPMSGIGVDWSAGKPVSIVTPQLYAYFDIPKLHVEWWSNIVFNSWLDDTAPDPWYNRLFVLYNATDWVSFGPQAEIEYVLEDRVTYLPVGGRVNMNFGKNNTVGLFGGYDTQIEDDGKLAGRITFVRFW